ncbi:unconventional myosin-XV-like isoform X2 [Branchiostoma lanceolatum]|uniref:unconventional myosin-XV-like isoform X2 n=1 Tax=Branchiostoma lanceolatum TaxID=7740 RepID=UPI003452E8FF
MSSLLDTSKQSPVWFDGGAGYPLPGEVLGFLGVKSNQLQIRNVLDEQIFVVETDSPSIRPRNRDEDGMANMINLRELHEGSVILNLKRRFEEHQIYTYIGSILVALNPYKPCDIYGVDVVKEYQKAMIGDNLPPHLFAVANTAFLKMVRTGKNQTVVISGESGAGKTESTKLIVQFLAASCNSTNTSLITEQILEANPLLESFGNAKTVKNDNSSRFGKYLELQYTNGVITGAKTTDYLLEKSRIVSQAPYERNYHIFYEMLAGMTEADKNKYGLQQAQSYYYLNQGGNPTILSKNDGEDFTGILAALDVLGFTADETDTVFCIVAAVLHLGNVYFGRNEEEIATVISQSELRVAAELLQLPFDGLHSAVTAKLTEALGEKIYSSYSVEQALEARDAIAKSLYQRLFVWLVERVNRTVYKQPERRCRTIGILDIFGFEDFDVNSFEQLCINFANEKLHDHFNKHIFKLEQMEYEKESIGWKHMTCPDNQLCLHLISAKPHGIFSLLNDQSSFPQATDRSFLEKCHHFHQDHEHYERPRVPAQEFSIRHCAGKVSYKVHGFLDKNKDTMRYDVVEMLIGSKCELLSRMFWEHQSLELNKSISKKQRGLTTLNVVSHKVPTVSAKFQESLEELLEEISKCNPLFVRCMKPNTCKAALMFDTDIVLEQLRNLGILDTIRIRKKGFPIRVPFKQFADRYKFMIGELSPDSDPRGVCIMILGKLGSHFADQFQLGQSKVFLREVVEHHLETERSRILNLAATQVQKVFRGHVAAKAFSKMKSAIVTIQAGIRMAKIREAYMELRRAVVLVQATWKMILQRRRYVQLREEAQRQAELDRLVQEKADKLAMAQQAREAADLSHMEIPAELSYIFDNIKSWHPQHTDRNVVKVFSHVADQPCNHSLPADVDWHQLSKYISIYLKGGRWGVTKKPISAPFHRMSNDDAHQAIAIFKMILRFMGDTRLTEEKERLLGNYIVQMGLKNEAVRDEILCQLCSQTWDEGPVRFNYERGWVLLTNCLSSWFPSPTLYKYLLNHVSNSMQNGFNTHCQHKMLHSPAMAEGLPRTYPPCILEWKTNRKLANMALETRFHDGEAFTSSVTSWTTGEEFAVTVLHHRGVHDENLGWTVVLQDGTEEYELAGYDYVLDLIAEMEMAPGFPVCKSFFLVSSDKMASNAEEVDISFSDIPTKVPPLLQGGASGYAHDGPIKHTGRLSQQYVHNFAQWQAANRRQMETVPAHVSDSSDYLPYQGDYKLPIRDYGLPPAPDYSTEDGRRFHQDPGSPPSSRSTPQHHVSGRRMGNTPHRETRVRHKSLGGRSLGGQSIPHSEVSQSGLDDYLDRLFNPVLSDDSSELGDAAGMEVHMKGGGQAPAPPGAAGTTGTSSTAPKMAGQNVDLTAANSMMGMQPGMMGVGLLPNMGLMQGVGNPVMMQQAMLQQQAYLAQQMMLLQQQQALLSQSQLPPQLAPGILTQHPSVDSRSSTSKPPSLSSTSSITEQRPVENDAIPTAVPMSPAASPSKGKPSPNEGLNNTSSPDPTAPPSTRVEDNTESDEEIRSHAFYTKTTPRIRVGNIEWPPVAEKPVKRRQRDVGKLMIDDHTTDLLSGSLQTKQPEPGQQQDEDGTVHVRISSGENKIPTKEAALSVHLQAIDKLKRGSPKKVSISPPTASPVKEPRPQTTSEGKTSSVTPTTPAVTKATAEEPKKSPVKTGSSVLPISPTNKQPKFLLKKKPDPHQEAMAKLKQVKKNLPSSNDTPASPAKKSPTVQKSVKTTAENILVQQPEDKKEENTEPENEDPHKAALAKIGGVIIKRVQSSSPARRADLPESDSDSDAMSEKSQDLKIHQEALRRLSQKTGRPVLPQNHPPDDADAQGLQREEPQDVVSLDGFPRSGQTKTELYPHNPGPYYTYTRVHWNLCVRKEVFNPTEKLENPTALNLVFAQVVHDVSRINSCLRMTIEESSKLQTIFDEHGITPSNLSQTAMTKKRVVDIARDFPTYFCRVFPVSGDRANPDVQMLGVSHSGVRFMRRDAESAFKDCLHVLREFRFKDIQSVEVEPRTVLHINLHSGNRIPLYTPRAKQIQDMIRKWIKDLEKESNYVRATRSYVTRDVPRKEHEEKLLSFQSGDVIKLLKELREDIHEDDKEKADRSLSALPDQVDGSENQSDWMLGEVKGDKGYFPKDYVQPVAHRSSLSSVSDPDRTSQAATDTKSDFASLPVGASPMMEYAGKYFREATTRPLAEEERLELVQFTKSPIEKPLLPLDKEFDQCCTDNFVSVMKYMGDYPLRGKDDTENAFDVIKKARRYPDVQDEIFCQIVKQTTANRSARKDGCVKGWRLLSLYSAYFPCSDNLKPYLIKHLHNVSTDTSEEHHAVAAQCLENLRATLTNGGRQKPPHPLEVKAIGIGRSTKRQMIVMPGSLSAVVKIKTCTLVHQIIEEICTRELAVTADNKIEEFSVYSIVEHGKEKENEVEMLGRKVYLMDVLTDFEGSGQEYTLILKKVVWYHPIKLDNENFVTLLYHQILPDFVSGRLVQVQGTKLSKQTMHDIARLTALAFRAGENLKTTPTMADIESALPQNCVQMQKVQQWANMIHSYLNHVVRLSANQARVQFIGTIMQWPLFGSSFYSVDSTTEPQAKEGCLIAINKSGIHFLPESHVPVVSYDFSNLVSTRKLRTKDGVGYLDIKLGNMLSQRVIRLETEQGGEISSLIQQYISIIISEKGAPTK